MPCNELFVRGLHPIVKGRIGNHTEQWFIVLYSLDVLWSRQKRSNPKETKYLRMSRHRQFHIAVLTVLTKYLHKYISSWLKITRFLIIEYAGKSHLHLMKTSNVHRHPQSPVYTSMTSACSWRDIAIQLVFLTSYSILYCSYPQCLFCSFNVIRKRINIGDEVSSPLPNPFPRSFCLEVLDNYLKAESTLHSFLWVCLLSILQSWYFAIVCYGVR